MSFFLKNSNHKNTSFHPANIAFNPPKEETNSTNTQNEPSMPTPEPPNLLTDLRNLRDIYHYFEDLKCRKCRTPIPLPNLETRVSTWLARCEIKDGQGKAANPMHISTLQCKKCKRDNCVGCRNKPEKNMGFVTSTKKDVKRYAVHNCCGNGKLFGVWVFLGVLDEISARELRRHLGNEKEKNLDDLLIRFLPILASFLPLPASTSGRTLVPLTFFDKNRPAELFALYRCSAFLLERIQVLVRNASLGDLVERFEVYTAVYEFLKALIEHGMVLLVTKRWDWKGKSPGLGLLEKEFSKGTNGEMVFEIEKGEVAESIAVACKGLFKQASTFFDLGEKQGIGFDTSDPPNRKRETLSFWHTSPKICRAVLKLKDKLVAKSPEILQVLNSLSGDRWAAYCAKNNVSFSDSVLEGHYFADGLANEGTSTERLEDIYKELVGLVTGLGKGVFVKISRERPDVMSLLVIGCKGPFEGGLFTFDFYLPPKWPKEQPCFQCTSAHNLFPTFSKFISLAREVSPLILTPGSSLLEQINTVANLLSSTCTSTFEKRNLQCLTVQYAMLTFLISELSPAQPSTKNINNFGIWWEVNQKYWNIHGRKVLERVKEWGIENEDLRYWENNDKNDKEEVDLVAELETALGDVENQVCFGVST